MDIAIYINRYGLDLKFPCPRCRTFHSLETAGVQVEEINKEIICSKCQLEFEVNIKFVARFFIVRAKRSKQNKASDSRHFFVRIIESNEKEDLIEFKKSGISDFELRAKDEAGTVDVSVSSHKADYAKYTKRYFIVHNFTIERKMEILRYEQYERKPSGSNNACFFATYLYGDESPEVALLRAFKHDVLSKRKTTVLAIKVYYFLGPKIIRAFGHKRSFRTVGIVIMRPVLYLVRWHQSKAVGQ